MKHMEEMKIAGLAMALCIVMLGIYIVVPKDGNISHLTAIPDNNAAEPVPDSTSQGSVDADSDSADFPIYTEDSYYSGSDDSDDNTDAVQRICDAMKSAENGWKNFWQSHDWNFLKNSGCICLLEC